MHLSSIALPRNKHLIHIAFRQVVTSRGRGPSYSWKYKSDLTVREIRIAGWVLTWEGNPQRFACASDWEIRFCLSRVASIWKTIKQIM